MDKERLIEQSELLMQDVDDHLDILNKRLRGDHSSTEQDEQKLRRVESGRDELQEMIDILQSADFNIIPDAQERLHLKIEDLKMRVARAIQVQE